VFSVLQNSGILASHEEFPPRRLPQKRAKGAKIFDPILRLLRFFAATWLGRVLVAAPPRYAFLWQLVW